MDPNEASEVIPQDVLLRPADEPQQRSRKERKNALTRTEALSILLLLDTWRFKATCST
jgi:hypothetical protein